MTRTSFGRADLTTALIAALAVSAAWPLTAAAVLSLVLPLWVTVFAGALLTVSLISGAVTPPRQAGQFRVSRTAGLGLQLGGLLGLLLVLGWRWALVSGFEAWLTRQTAWWAYWQWF